MSDTKDIELTKDIDEARIEVDSLTGVLLEMGRDIDAIQSADRVRTMALTKVRRDWEHMTGRIHKIANELVKLQERHALIVEGPPPGPAKERP